MGIPNGIRTMHVTSQSHAHVLHVVVVRVSSNTLNHRVVGARVIFHGHLMLSFDLVEDLRIIPVVLVARIVLSAVLIDETTSSVPGQESSVVVTQGLHRLVDERVARGIAPIGVRGIVGIDVRCVELEQPIGLCSKMK